MRRMGGKEENLYRRNRFVLDGEGSKGYFSHHFRFSPNFGKLGKINKVIHLFPEI